MSHGAVQKCTDAAATKITAKELTEARNQLAVGNQFRSLFQATHPHRKELSREFEKLDQQLVTLQRDQAKPLAYHFEIRAVQK